MKWGRNGGEQEYIVESISSGVEKVQELFGEFP